MAYNSKHTGAQIEALLDSVPGKADKSGLGTAAGKNVPANGDAAKGQVVMGNDSRLSDPREASDVPAWAKAATKPSYTAEEVGALPSSTKVPTKTSELDNDSGFLKQHQSLTGYVKATELAAVAKSGSYNDLTDKPSVSSSRMTVNSVAAEAETSLQLTLNNIYELVGTDYESMIFTLPAAPALSDRDKEIIIRFSVGDIPPPITFSATEALNLAGSGSLSVLDTGLNYEFSIIYTSGGWNIAYQTFVAIAEE